MITEPADQSALQFGDLGPRPLLCEIREHDRVAFTAINASIIARPETEGLRRDRRQLDPGSSRTFSAR